MPLQNRVMPDGRIVAIPLRGTLTGNRGILHDAERRLGGARWRGKAWICCTLEWKGVRRVPMTPGTWTELFFHDEAVALAAGHRPCALCRRDRFRAFQAAWIAAGLGEARAPRIDAGLHAARTRRAADGSTHRAECAGLPDGAMILTASGPALVRADQFVPFGEAGYGLPFPRARGVAPVLTPWPMLAILATGYRPALHPSLDAQVPGFMVR